MIKEWKCGRPQEWSEWEPLLQHPESEQRLHAIEAARALVPFAIAAPYFETLLEDGSETVRGRVLHALYDAAMFSKSNEPMTPEERRLFVAMAPRIGSLLLDPHVHLRLQACAVLSELGHASDEVLEALRGALLDKNQTTMIGDRSYVCVEALRALLNLEAADVSTIQRPLSDENAEIRAAVQHLIDGDGQG